MKKVSLLLILPLVGMFYQLKAPLEALTATQARNFPPSGASLIPGSQWHRLQIVGGDRKDTPINHNTGGNTDGNLLVTQSPGNSTDNNSNANEAIEFDTQMSPEDEMSRKNMEETLDQGDMDKALPQMEQLWEDELEKHFGTTFADQQITAEDVRKKLAELEIKTGKKTAVVYVFCQPKHLIVGLKTAAGKATHYRIPQNNRDDVYQVVKTFIREVANPGRTRTTTYLASAQQLYQWIIAPIEPTLKAEGIDTLLFSLDTHLRSLPIAALHDGKQFLIEKYSIGITPNINLTNASFTSLKNAKILAMGASNFPDLNPLPAVPLELAAIVSTDTSPQQGLWSGIKFLNEAFTLDNLKAQRQKQPFQIIHLATHGEFNPGAPSNSYIHFWNAKLTLDQIKQLNFHQSPVELLVLSACKTALGSKHAQFGFAGMAVHSGAKSAIASLWYVSDQGTLALMSEFYRQLKTVPIKAEALRQAQIAMLKGDITVQGDRLLGTRGSVQLPPELANTGDIKLSHPYYWSAFTIIGSPW